MIIIRGVSTAYTKLFMTCTINHLVLSTGFPLVAKNMLSDCVNLSGLLCLVCSPGSGRVPKLLKQYDLLYVLLWILHIRCRDKSFACMRCKWYWLNNLSKYFFHFPLPLTVYSTLKVTELHMLLFCSCQAM